MTVPVVCLLTPQSSLEVTSEPVVSQPHTCPIASKSRILGDTEQDINPLITVTRLVLESTSPNYRVT
jgi:hypothetical protein